MQLFSKRIPPPHVHTRAQAHFIFKKRGNTKKGVRNKFDRNFNIEKASEGNKQVANGKWKSTKERTKDSSGSFSVACFLVCVRCCLWS